ncbi:hypothetical protein LOTGIDRAFT_153128 [Lottia gigantea]|uniref:Uncharacterized protein n=1 Tax=Lottia gigantea TaxID=225164 RepID=V4AJE2_LOTGI|nr:hypothetical protein LOTGIDRAFT_153128 [Lottia gigantea]ESO93676.1 hypothetical protein LOTGIDRAFT_153128 [Lottia gigantea]
MYKTDSSGDLQIEHDSNETQFRPTFNGDIQNRQPQYTGRKDSLQYQDVMRRLVSRLIHQYKKQARQDGVNEDDLLEIKQDISSLRYELREDRKKEHALLTGNMDSLRKDPFGSFQFISPGASPRIPHSRSSPNTSSKYCGQFSKHELDYLKHEIVKSMKSELRETVYGCFSNFTNQQAMSNLGPLDSELYQTHLYTSL